MSRSGSFRRGSAGVRRGSANASAPESNLQNAPAARAAAAAKRKSLLDGTDLYQDVPAGGHSQAHATVAAAREAIGRAPEKRNDDDVAAILKFAQEVEFFAQLSEFQQLGLCKTMQHEQFGKWEVVFSWQDEGDKFYIILSGRLEVRIPSRTAHCPNDLHEDPQECICFNREMELASYLEPGHGFGELALINDQPRSATILAQEETHLLVVTRAEYKRFAGRYHKEFLDQRVRFLKEVPQIEEALQQGIVSEQDVASMANCLTEMRFYGNAIVAEQGEAVDRIILVHTGQLSMVRAVDVEVRPDPRQHRFLTHGKLRAATAGTTVSMEQSQLSDDDMESLTSGLSASSPSRPPRTSRVNTKRKLLKIGVVGAYQYYGERQFFKAEPFPVSLVSEALALVYVASRQIVMRRMPKAFMTALLSGTEVEVASDDKLLEMHAHTERWQAYCQDLHDEALIRREQQSATSMTGFRRKARAGAKHTSSVVLSHQENAFFSDANASFLRRHGEVAKDQRPLALKDGSLSRCEPMPEPGNMNYRLANQWSRLGEGIIVQDLELVLAEQHNSTFRLTRARKSQRSRLESRLSAKFQKNSANPSLVRSGSHMSSQLSLEDEKESLDATTSSGMPAGGVPGNSAGEEKTSVQPSFPTLPKSSLQTPRLTTAAPQLVQVRRKHGGGRRRLLPGGSYCEPSLAQRFPPYHDRSFRQHLA